MSSIREKFNKWYEENRYLAAGAISLMLVILVNLVQPGSFLQTNLLGTGNADNTVFTGTALPYCKGIVAPKAMYGEYRGQTWEQIPDTVKIPQLPYNYTALRSGTASNDELRLYSVPYGAAYASPMQDGSHMAVDIMQPVGTPICAIANGQVVKAVVRNDGCGNTVVIRHDNVDGETLYSGYCHLDSIDGRTVKEGSWIAKGTVLGRTGSTGLGTSPHLHFQLDKDSAPFHPYWSFTFAEAEAAGLDFFDAVNAGLNREQFMKHTKDPMEFVQKYLNVDVATGQSVDVNDVPFSGGEIDEAPSVVEQPVSEPILSSDSPVNTDRLATLVPAGQGMSVLEVELPENLIVNREYQLTIKAIANIDQSILQDTLKIYSEGAEAEFPDGRKLDYDQFADGKAIVRFVVQEPGRVRISLKNRDITAHSSIADVSLFSDLAFNHPQFTAFESLYENGVITGYEDGSVKPQNYVKRIELAKMVIVNEGISLQADLGTIAYADTIPDSWYEKYLGVACFEQIACGDPDGRFRPEAQVILPEMLKMIFEASNVNVESLVSGSRNAYAKEIDLDQWYADYLIAALAMGIIDQEVLMDLSKPVTRLEAARLLAKVNEL